MGRGKSQRSLDLIEAAVTILDEIQPATVRAVCYKLFVLGLITSMAKNETNKVSRLLTDARERGDLPWNWIVDETRDAERQPGWEDPRTFLEVVKRAYRRDHWALQPKRLEVWSEKGTIRGMIAPVLREYGVTFRVMHGYASATAVREIVLESARSTKPFQVLYVGDWDPSGLHMSEEDLPNRLHTYWADYWQQQGVAWWHEDFNGPPEITMTRLALTEADIRTGDLPSFSADTKRGDPRWQWYMDYMDFCYGNDLGGQCWELDALNPNVLRDRIKQAVRDAIDRPQWERSTTAEQAERDSLVEVMNGWHGILGQASQ